MLIYNKIFENIKNLNCNFPIEDQYYADENQAIVADGITRDPVGVLDLSTCTFKEILEKYPRPSGAYLASKKICDTFSLANGTLKERLKICNDKVKELNEKYIKECDYLQNDFYGAVASCIKVTDNTLEYAYICDCGVIVYDKFGNIKFQTEDDKLLYSDPYINKIGIPWNLPEARVIVRRDYRNNLSNTVNGKCVSYGALTGENDALAFIKVGKIKLKEGDLIALYTDGFTNFLHDKEFIKLLCNFNKETFENYINYKSSFDSNKYGKEKTIVLLKK